MINKRLLAQLGLIITTVICGSTFLLVKNSVEAGTTPFTFIFYRFIIAIIMIIPFILFSKDKGSSIIQFNRNEVLFGIICGFFLYVGYVFQTYGLERTLATKSAFITGTSVLIVPFIIYLYKRDRIGYELWLSILVVILGLYLFTNPGTLTEVELAKAKIGELNVRQQALPNIGDLLTFGCAIFFAMHIVGQSDAVQNKINLIRFLSIQFLTVAILSGLSTFFTGGFVANYDSQLLTSLIINGVFASTIAIFLMVWAQKILTAAETAIIFSLEPIFCLLFEIIVGETDTIGLFQWGGGILVVIAVIYYSIASEK